MKVLLHSCCAVCLPGPLQDLRHEGALVTVYWYNPNVHPLLEWRKRLKALKLLQPRLGFDARYDETYDLELFFRTVLADLDARCRLCYRLRLGEAARAARALGTDAFATTLAASSHQDHQLLLEEGRRAADEGNVEFLYRDWRALHEAGAQLARKLSLYRQQYCGCIWSEEERFKNTSKELPRPGGR
ncbi:MAG: epoxyqueuosine reductase QueH [Planctomycetota bacterium]